MLSNPIRSAASQSLNALNRRDLLKAAALAVASAATPAWASHLRTKFRKNIRLGITSMAYGAMPLSEVSSRAKGDGFHSVLTNFQFADVRFDPLAPDWSAAEKILNTFEKQGLPMAALYGYYNVVDPNESRRAKGEARMEFLIRNGKRLRCGIVSTESGTFNPKSEWLESPENDTEAGYEKVKAAFTRWARLAEKHDMVMTVECYWRNVIGSVDRAERLLKEVDSPALKLVMDPCNYLRAEDLGNMQPRLKEIFQRLGKQFVIAHAKDVKQGPKGLELPGPGKGQLDYPLFLRLLAELDRPMDLVIEHLRREEIPQARDFVLAQIEKLP